MANVVVIGAGVIGAACAWRLAQAGARVTLVEREAAGGQASRAALGVLQYHAKVGLPNSYQALTARSQALFPAMVDELAALTGQQVPYTVPGLLQIALKPADLPGLEALAAANAGRPEVAMHRLEAGDCLRLEPALNPCVLGGVLLPGDAWVDNVALTAALAGAAQLAGARLVRATVEAVLSAAGRASGVRADGRDYPADCVVLAAGAWAGGVAGMPPLPVRPVRGQALAVAGQPLRHMVASAAGYVVPRGTDGCLVGATVEEASFETAITLEGLAAVSAIGMDISPTLAGCAFRSAWSGLRPATPDGLPFIGPFAEMPSLIVAAGHFRNGILLAPVTAEIVCALAGGSPPPLALDDFAPGRLRAAAAGVQRHTSR